jgi:Ca-activated chloride channel homolog
MIATLSQFHLMRPEWLWAAVPALILTALLWRLRKRSGGWSDVIAPDLLPFLVGETAAARGPNLLPFILAGWLLAALAASGPSWEKIPQPVHQRQDAMVLVLDLSLSMMAEDLSPSRLARAQQKLLDLLAQREEGQTGLIAYAGDSHVVTPLTDDNPTIANLLPVLSPHMMPLPGSDSAAAIEQAIDLLHSAGIAQGKILLLTDGVDKSAGKRIEKLLQGSGMKLTILAVGTELGAPIPLPQGGFLKDSSGTIVIPKLDRNALSGLARSAGGRYLNIQIDDSDLDQLLSDTLLPGEEQTMELERTADSWDDKGYLLVLLLLPLVLPAFRRGWLLCLLPALMLGGPERAYALSWDDLWYTPDQQGQKALENGEPQRAQQLFEDKQWAGTAAYDSEDYESAVQQFSEGDSADDWYNRGNALARAGKIDEAIEAYKESLARKADQTDAMENLALLEQQKQQREQQQQDKPEDGEPSENEDQQSGDQEGESDSDEDSDQSPEGEQQPSEQPPESSPESDPPENPDQGEQPESPEEETGDAEQPEPQPDQPEQPSQDEAAPAQAEEASPEDQEKEQAMQQWLRRIPDDPSGLLREKFRYESQQRQQQGKRGNNESNW